MADRVRINISVDADDLAVIDAAATEAGEDRSRYMVTAALARAGHPTEGDRLAALEREVRILRRALEAAGVDL